MRDVVLDVGGLRLRLTSRHPELLDVARTRYAGFLTTGPADWEIVAAPGETEPCGVAAPADGDVSVRLDGAPDRLDVRRYDFRARLDLRARSGSVTLFVCDELALDSFLRVAWSFALVAVGGVLIHAASLARDEQAYVFPGRSGAGKTTVARLSPESRLLSDELSIVRVDGESVRGYGTPFWGELARGGGNERVPVAGLYFLRQANRHEAIRCTRTRAVAALMPHVVFFSRDPRLVARALDVAATVAARVPCFDLLFRRDAGFWGAIDAA